MDAIDRRILEHLQQDSDMLLAELATAVGLSATPCWRRIQRLKKSGVIRRNVALVDAAKVNLGITVFVSIKTGAHDQAWFERFKAAVQAMPEVVEFHRLSGEVDYLLRVVVPDIARYDALYKRLIADAGLVDVSSSFAMETIKSSTALPLDHAG